MLDKNDFMIKSIALESEKKANQSKSAFLSRMSHDMRTPLNGITGLLKINENHFDDIDLVKEKIPVKETWAPVSIFLWKSGTFAADIF